MKLTNNNPDNYSYSSNAAGGYVIVPAGQAAEVEDEVGKDLLASHGQYLSEVQEEMQSSTGTPTDAAPKVSADVDKASDTPAPSVEIPQETSTEPQQTEEGEKNPEGIAEASTEASSEKKQEAVTGQPVSGGE
jgi:hypothetical protein